MESSSSSRSSKRAKPGSVTQVVSCLVDGCNSDLSQCREYHRRHKVCALHSKTPKVTIGGMEKRFCQQCSRFHSLVEFDEGKRSCRKRLDGHNRRRRKPQSGSLPRNPGGFLSNQQGTTFLSFSSPQISPSAVVSSACVGKEFQILQGNYTSLREACIYQPVQHNPAPGNSDSSQKMFYNGLDSESVHSLLSSAAAETQDVGFRFMAQPDFIPPAPQSLIHNLHYSSLVQFSSFQEVSDFNSDGSSKANTHCQGIFQNQTDGSLASGSHQHTLSFKWE